MHSINYYQKNQYDSIFINNQQSNHNNSNNQSSILSNSILNSTYINDSTSKPVPSSQSQLKKIIGIKKTSNHSLHNQNALNLSNKKINLTTAKFFNHNHQNSAINNSYYTPLTKFNNEESQMKQVDQSMRNQRTQSLMQQNSTTTAGRLLFNEHFSREKKEPVKKQNKIDEGEIQEMVEALKSNILRDLQEVSKKFIGLSEKTEESVMNRFSFSQAPSVASQENDMGIPKSFGQLNQKKHTTSSVYQEVPNPERHFSSVSTQKEVKTCFVIPDKDKPPLVRKQSPAQKDSSVIDEKKIDFSKFTKQLQKQRSPSPIQIQTFAEQLQKLPQSKAQIQKQPKSTNFQKEGSALCQQINSVLKNVNMFYNQIQSPTHQEKKNKSNTPSFKSEIKGNPPPLPAPNQLQFDSCVGSSKRSSQGHLVTFEDRNLDELKVQEEPEQESIKIKKEETIEYPLIIPVRNASPEQRIPPTQRLTDETIYEPFEIPNQEFDIPSSEPIQLLEDSREIQSSVEEKQEQSNKSSHKSSRISEQHSMDDELIQMDSIKKEESVELGEPESEVDRVVSKDSSFDQYKAKLCCEEPKKKQLQVETRINSLMENFKQLKSQSSGRGNKFEFSQQNDTPVEHISDFIIYGSVVKESLKKLVTFQDDEFSHQNRNTPISFLQYKQQLKDDV